jgi:hypothetical protein
MVVRVVLVVLQVLGMVLMVLGMVFMVLGSLTSRQLGTLGTSKAVLQFHQKVASLVLAKASQERKSQAKDLHLLEFNGSLNGVSV